MQAHGLDSAGSPPSSDGTGTGPKPISAELVDGEREALYWNKVPEKVRREAVRKAMAMAHASQTAEGGVVGGGEERGRATAEEKGKQDKRPRKRRRKA